MTLIILSTDCDAGNMLV